LTTPSTNLLSQPSPAVIDTNIEACISNSLTKLLSEGCNVIICLSHLGINYDEQIASSVPGINLIVSAHDHSAASQPVEIKNPSGGTTYLVESGAFYSNIGKLKLLVDAGNVSLLSYELIPLDQSVPEEPSVAAAVSSLISDIETTYGPMFSQQVGQADSFLKKLRIHFCQRLSLYSGRQFGNRCLSGENRNRYCNNSRRCNCAASIPGSNSCCRYF